MATAAQVSRLTAEVGELVAARERTARDRRDFARYADDPVGFLRDVLKAEPWAKQREIAGLVREHALVAVRSANSIGKDWLAARLALWWVYARGGLVLLTGPTERQVVEILMKKEVARAFRAGRLAGELFATALRPAGSGEAGILAMTSTEAGRLTGFHDARVLAVITEAQDVEDFAWEALMACAVGAHDRVLAVGNPLRPVGRFYVASRRSSQWRKVAIAASDHPNVIEGREVIPGGVTREWVARQRAEWGEDSPIYVARVLGEFPESAENALVARAWLERAVEHFETRRFDRESRASGWRVGLDVARSGEDSTALALRRGPVLREVVTWHGADTMQSAGRVIAFLQDRHLGKVPPEFGPGIADPRVSIVVDVIGLGAGVLDRLTELGWAASGHNSSARPRGRSTGLNDPDRFLNRRAETFWHLREELERGAIALPRDEALFEELLATRYLIGSNGKIQIEAKVELRARLGRSPDRADAVAMAFGGSRCSGGGAMLDV